MKKKMIRNAIYIIFATGILFLTSCAQPSPLSGTWIDNVGNSVTLYPNYQYTAKIISSDGVPSTTDGNYNVLMNVICFTAKDGYQVVTEWDIRGSMLYIEWTDKKGRKLQLTLFKSKN